MNFPCWLYHDEFEPLLIKDEDGHKKLGKGWVDSPAKLKGYVEVSEKPAVLEEEPTPEKPKRKKKDEGKA